MIKLYDYFRSTASYRVRIALNIKQLPYEKTEIHLVKDGGQQHQATYQNLNPQGLVPALGDGDQIISQSLAIIEYLEEQYPDTAKLLPTNPFLRAKVRAFAQHIACDIHPINNLRVLKFFTETFNHSEQEKMQWYHHWVQCGFKALETQLQQEKNTGPFCFGEQPSLADVCLVPQMFNARRFECPLDNYPRLVEIDTHCQSLEAFKNAAP